MIPKGKLLLIGGHEDKGEVPGENLHIRKKHNTTHFEILGALISKIPRAHHIVEIIASASSIPDEMEKLYISAFKEEGFTHVGIIRIENETGGSDAEALKRIKSAHAVFFTGGDQQKLVSLIGGTPMLKAIENKYHSDEHFIVAGTSAGAMAIPEVIITGGIIGAALFKGDIKIGSGIDLIKNLLIDTHFIKRGRFARLAHAVTLNPSCLGIGLEENTALLISEGNHAECLGSGMVIVIDGANMGATNINQVDDNTPIVVENLKVSILAEGSCYLLTERKGISKR